MTDSITTSPDIGSFILLMRGQRVLVDADLDPAHEGRLLKAAAEAIRAACPDARVLFGGLASYDFRNLDDPWSFLREVGEAHADICAFFDVLAIHPNTLPAVFVARERLHRGRDGLPQPEPDDRAGAGHPGGHGLPRSAVQYVVVR